MKLSQIFPNVEISQDVEIRGISIDTRKVYHGDLFVCIKGFTVDGHDFAREAVKKGAVAVLCAHGFEEDFGVPKIYAEDTRYALSAACKIFYKDPAVDIKIIGITGTNGKSSTVYFVEEILRSLGYRVGAIGTMGARLGGVPLEIPFVTSTTPDTVELYRMIAAMRDARAEYLVMEVTSHGLALEKVSHLTLEIGAFTNLTQDHLDFHGTMENYLAAKARIFDISKKGVINADDDTKNKLLALNKCPMQTYGTVDADFIAKDIRLYAGHVSYIVEGVEVSVPIPGKFTAYNTLCAYAICRNLGFAPQEIADALARLKGVAGRIQKIENNRDITIIVDYAHTPDGLGNIISSCREFTKGKVIVLFGAGGDRDHAKRPIMGEVAGRLSDHCIITSDNPRNENPEDIIKQIVAGIIPTNCTHASIVDRKEAIFTGIGMLDSGDCLIIAGKGHEDYQEFENKRRVYFDDAKMAQEALERLQ